MNALARRDVAIVSETAGTTRDVIEVRLDLGGYLVTLADTAGLRDTADAIEQRRRPPGTGPRRSRRSGDPAAGRHGSRSSCRFAGADLVVWNKADLPWPEARDGLRLSLKTGEGLDALIAALTAKVAKKLESPAEAPPHHPRPPPPCAGRSSQFALPARKPPPNPN